MTRFFPIFLTALAVAILFACMADDAAAAQLGSRSSSIRVPDAPASGGQVPPPTGTGRPPHVVGIVIPEADPPDPGELIVRLFIWRVLFE
jgi:hypothetical protein